MPDMVEIVFRPPLAILLVAVGIVIVGIASAFIRKGEPMRKITSIVIVVLVAGGLVLFLYRPATITVDAEGFSASGPRGVDVSWDEVTHAHDVVNLATSEFRPTVRSRGAAIGDYRAGRFLLSNGNAAWVMMERSDRAVVLVTPELTYLIAPEEIDTLVAAVDRFRPLPAENQTAP